MKHSPRLGFAMLALAGLLAIGLGTPADAQDPSPTPTPNDVVTHPAHIHKGTCAQLDPNPQYPLDDVGPRKDSDGNLPKSSDLKGSLTASPVEYSDKKIDAKLDDLLSEAHALNVHESAQNIQNYIACGDIGGYVIDDTLVIGLKELNNSGYSGIAILKKDGDKTEVTVYLASGLSGAAPTGTPTA